MPKASRATKVKLLSSEATKASLDEAKADNNIANGGVSMHTNLHVLLNSNSLIFDANADPNAPISIVFTIANITPSE